MSRQTDLLLGVERGVLVRHQLFNPLHEVLPYFACRVAQHSLDLIPIPAVPRHEVFEGRAVRSSRIGEATGDIEPGGGEPHKPSARSYRVMQNHIAKRLR